MGSEGYQGPDIKLQLVVLDLPPNVELSRQGISKVAVVVNDHHLRLAGQVSAENLEQLLNCVEFSVPLSLERRQLCQRCRGAVLDTKPRWRLREVTKATNVDGELVRRRFQARP